MTATELVVSADGRVLEPTDLFRTRLPENLRDHTVWEEDFEIEPWVEGGASIFQRLHSPGSRGGRSAVPAAGGPMPDCDPSGILGTWTSTASTSRCCSRTSRCSRSTPMITSSRSRTLVCTTTGSSSGTRRTSGLAPTAPVPITDIRRRGRGDRARVAARPGSCAICCRDPPKPYYSPATSTRCGRPRRPTGARLRPHADRRREGQGPGVDDAQGRDGVGRGAGSR